MKPLTLTDHFDPTAFHRSMEAVQADIRHARIKWRAEQLWIAAGKPAGRDLEFWSTVERQVEVEEEEAHRNGKQAGWIVLK